MNEHITHSFIHHYTPSDEKMLASLLHSFILSVDLSFCAHHHSFWRVFASVWSVPIG